MSIPYLQSERHFRLYEQYIDEIVKAWPKVVVFTPQPPIASVETLSSRLRMCMKSLRANLWPTTLDIAKFLQIVDEVVVSTTLEPGKVACGPYDLLRKRVAPNLPVEVQTNELTQVVPRVKLTNPPHDLIDAVVVLHHYRLLSEPSEIVTDKDMECYTKLFDVSVQKDGDRYIVI